MPESDFWRTSAFVLSPDDYGSVYFYRAGSDFQEAWDRLCGRWKRMTGETVWNLPYSSLNTALRVLTGDFARAQVNPKRAQGEYLLVSRRPISVDDRRDVLRAWEDTVMGDDALQEISKQANDFVESKENVWNHVQIREEACPNTEGWVWDTAYWNVAHQLKDRPLHHDAGSMSLRVDSDAQLVGWDDLIEAGSPPRKALLYIQPKLITVPGLERPALQLRSLVSRLAPRWWDIGRIRKAWVDYKSDHPLAFVEVRQGNGSAFWDDQLPEVLRRCDVTDFPNPDDVTLGEDSQVRARLASPGKNFPVGKGPGQPFHDAVAVWARNGLSNADPVELGKSVYSLSRPETAKISPTENQVETMLRESENTPVRLVCLYETPSTRERMRHGLVGSEDGGEAVPIPESVAELDIEDGEVLKVTMDLEVVFRSPEGTDILTTHGEESDIKEAVLNALSDDTEWLEKNDGMLAVLAETLPSEAWDRNTGKADPKFEVRTVLGQRGIPVQFLAKDVDVRKTDHRAVRSAWDLFRGAGLFPHEFPDHYLTSGSEEEPWLVGAACTKPSSWNRARPATTSSRGGEYVLRLVSARAGTQTAFGYDPKNGWGQLGEMTARFHGEHRVLFTKQEARSTLNGALGDLPGPAILFVEAQNLRQIWSGLQDTVDEGELPRALDSMSALMRVRSATEKEIPQPAGRGNWPGRGPGEQFYSVDALLELADTDFEGGRLYAASSNQYDSRSNRWLSRFSPSMQQNQEDTLQSVIATEFLCLQSGPFQKQDLYKHAAVLCRYSPSWTSVLRQPAPLHLAHSIIEDHPLSSQ